METLAKFSTLIIFVIPILTNIICAGFCSFLAGAKKRRNVDWFFWGLLFGPIALIAAAGMPVKREYNLHE